MNKRAKIALSVVVAAYNEEAYIGRAVDSLLAQDFALPYEIIVVDNNSSDDTAKVAKSHGAKVIFEPKQGVCYARQTGTEAAKGEIVVSTDADTQFEPNWLSRIYQAFEANPQAVVVAGPCRFVNAPRWIFVYGFLMRMTIKIYQKTGYLWYAFAANLAFRKVAWQQIGGYNVKLTQGGDELDLINRMRTKGQVTALPDNYVYTSSRRLNRGFLYMLGVTLAFYFAEYGLSRLAGRPVLGSYKPIRTEKPRRWVRATVYALYLLAFLIAAHAGLANTAYALSHPIHAMGSGIHKIRTITHRAF